MIEATHDGVLHDLCLVHDDEAWWERYEEVRADAARARGETFRVDATHEHGARYEGAPING